MWETWSLLYYQCFLKKTNKKLTTTQYLIHMRTDISHRTSWNDAEKYVERVSIDGRTVVLLKIKDSTEMLLPHLTKQNPQTTSHVIGYLCSFGHAWSRRRQYPAGGRARDLLWNGLRQRQDGRSCIWKLLWVNVQQIKRQVTRRGAHINTHNVFQSVSRSQTISQNTVEPICITTTIKIHLNSALWLYLYSDERLVLNVFSVTNVKLKKIS